MAIHCTNSCHFFLPPYSYLTHNSTLTRWVGNSCPTVRSPQRLRRPIRGSACKEIQFCAARSGECGFCSAPWGDSFSSFWERCQASAPARTPSEHPGPAAGEGALCTHSLSQATECPATCLLGDSGAEPKLCRPELGLNLSFSQSCFSFSLHGHGCPSTHGTPCFTHFLSCFQRTSSVTEILKTFRCMLGK